MPISSLLSNLFGSSVYLDNLEACAGAGGPRAQSGQFFDAIDEIS